MSFFRFSLGLLFFMICCSVPERAESEKSPQKPNIAGAITDTSGKNGLPADTTIYLYRNKDSVKVMILVPEKIRGTILILHGWNLKPEEIGAKTDFCKQSLDSGYVLILPDFGKSTYQWQNYPQTRKDWLRFPTRSWMYDTMITELQNSYKMLLPGERNFVYGLSTGGRGAALFALEKPEIFKAAACLSADFDHSALMNEPINNGYYGPITEFPERWTGKDNIYNRAAEFRTGLFLGHGLKDKVCPPEQTLNFMIKLKEVNPDLKVKSDTESAGDHSYKYWGKQTPAILGFFAEF